METSTEPKPEEKTETAPEPKYEVNVEKLVQRVSALEVSVDELYRKIDEIRKILADAKIA